MGWYTYRDKSGKQVFVDDVVCSDDPEKLDDSKLPDDVKEYIKLGKPIRFYWNKKQEEYVLKLHR